MLLTNHRSGHLEPCNCHVEHSNDSEGQNMSSSGCRICWKGLSLQTQVPMDRVLPWPPRQWLGRSLGFLEATSRDEQLLSEGTSGAA